MICLKLVETPNMSDMLNFYLTDHAVISVIPLVLLVLADCGLCLQSSALWFLNPQWLHGPNVTGL